MTKKEDKKGTGRKKAASLPAETNSPAETESLAETESAPEGDSVPSSADESPPSTDESEPSAKRTVLPAFGFAADLLKQSAETGARSSSKAGSSGEDGAPEDGAPEDGEGDDSDARPARAAGSEAGSSTGIASPSDGETATMPSFESSGLDMSGSELADPDAVDASSPSRLFDFADQVTARTAREAEAARPVRMATFVTFSLADETFAMPVTPVRQIVRVSSITRVPHAPRPVRGVTNLRGRVIPVVDLRARVGLPPIEIDRAARVIAVASKGRLLGLLVDAVHQVVHLDLEQVQPPPEDVMSLQSDYIEGVYGEGDELVLLLDVDRALILREAGAA